MNLTTLNDLVFIAFALGVLVNWLLKNWVFDIRTVAANFLIVCFAWFITEFYITNVPQNPFFKTVYVVGLTAFSFSPFEIFLFIVTLSKSAFKNWATKKADTLTQETTKTETTKTEITKP